MSCWAVIVAAGRGSRAGLGVNKVFHAVGGRTVLGRCLDDYADMADIMRNAVYRFKFFTSGAVSVRSIISPAGGDVKCLAAEKFHKNH